MRKVPKKKVKSRDMLRSQPTGGMIDRGNRAGNLKVAKEAGFAPVTFRRRHTTYSDELMDRIFDEMATGKLIEEICEDPGMPSPYTIYGWFTDPSKPELAERYRFARVQQCDALARNTQRIAQTILPEIRTRTIYDAKGNVLSKQISEQDNVARSALIVGTQQWLLSKLFPKKYGERLQLTAEVDDTLLKEMVNAIGGSPTIAEEVSMGGDENKVIDITTGPGSSNGTSGH